MAMSGLWERAKPWTAKRSGHAVNGGLEGRRERRARGHRQPRLAADERPFPDAPIRMQGIRLSRTVIVLGACVTAFTGMPTLHAQALLDLPRGTAAPRPLQPEPAPAAFRTGVFLEPFAPSAALGSEIVPAAVWQLQTPEQVEPLALPPPATIAAPARGLPAPPARLTTSAAADLAAVGQLAPDQEIHAIDLAGALRLAGARDLDVAIARARVSAAAADVRHARALWLPSMFIGPNWIRHDGQVQIVEGPVRTVSKSSFFLGATAAGGSSVSGPIPAGGPAQVSGLTTVLRFSDAIFLPLAAEQIVDARHARVRTATNDALLGVAESYMELQRAAGRLAIAREAADHADRLATIAAAFAKTGAGLEGDHQRSLVERDRRLADVEAALGGLEVASADVVRRTRLNPALVVAPVEPAELVLEMVADDVPVDTLIEVGLRNRPELAEARSFVEETLLRLRQARLRPFIPSLAFRYSGGGFGGGANSFFGDFASRSDADVNLYWETANLGFTDSAIRGRREAERREADLQLLKVQDTVAAEVMQAEKARLAARRQLARIEAAVPEAIRSLELNFLSIREAAGLPVPSTRPIEVLQPIQALADARAGYLDAVIAYNTAQFRLFHALGRAPTAPAIVTPVPEAVTTPASTEEPQPVEGTPPVAAS
jgi:outer membrane protein TolC